MNIFHADGGANDLLASARIKRKPHSVYYKPPEAHQAIIDAPEKLVALERKIDQAITKLTHVGHGIALILKGQHREMSSYADLKTEIDANIVNQNAAISSFDSFQAAAQALVQQLESNNDYDTALSELKNQDAALTAASAQAKASLTSLSQTAATVPAPPATTSTTESTQAATGVGAATGATTAGTAASTSTDAATPPQAG